MGQVALKPADFQCVGCKVIFASEGAFDRHRTGTHEYTFAEGLAMDPSCEDGRRCRDEDEMRAKETAPNSYGRWTFAKNLQKDFGRESSAKADS